MSGDNLFVTTTGYTITSAAGTRTLTFNTLALDPGVGLTFEINSGTGSATWSLGTITSGAGSSLTLKGGATAGNADILRITTETTISVDTFITSSVTGAALGYNLGVTGAAIGSPKAATINSNVTNNSSAFFMLGANQFNTLTYGGKITGTGGVEFTSDNAGAGAGTIILNSNTSDYTGKTVINNSVAGIVKLGINNALPSTTALQFGNGGANSVGVLDLNGKNLTIGSLATNITGAGVANGITNTVSGTPSTLTIDGSTSTTFTGVIGIPVASTVTGASNNIVLVKSGAGTLTLAGTTANTYTGLTTVNGGELDLSKTSGVNAIAANLTIGDGTGTDTVKLLAADQIADTSDLTLNSSGVLNLNNNNETIDALNGVAGSSVTLGTATLTVGANNEATADFAGVISGAGGNPTKTGTGTQTLSGISANTFTGITTVNAGELDLNKTAGTNAIAGNLTIGDSSGTDTVKLLAADQIANTSDVTINSSGVLNLNDNNETIDALNGVAGSSVTLGTGALTVGANNEAAANFHGVISGTGGFTKVGIGGTQILSGTNTYSGDTQILAGDLRFDSGGTANSSTIRLGDTSGSNYAVLSLGVGSGNDVGSILEVRAGSSGTKVLRSLNTSGINTYSGAITLNTGLTLEATTDGTLLLQGGSLNLQSNTLTIDSQVVNAGVGPNGADAVGARGTVRIFEVVSGTGGSIVKDGSGTLILQGVSNTYTGGTTIKGGILGIYGDGSLGTAPGVAANNIFFAASAASNPTATQILQDASGDVSIVATRNVNIATSVTGTFDSNGNIFTISGNINGAGNLNKIGAGTLVLTGANTYTGTTTVSTGTLNAAATGALGGTTGNITVNNGGTLLLTGAGNLNRINDTTPIVLGNASGGNPTFARSGAGTVSEGSGATRTGGILNPGTSSVGLGALSLQSNATLNFDLLSTGGVGTFTFASFTPGTFTLNILNWSSSADFTTLTSGVDGTDDRLIFGGGAPPDTAFITFNGAASALIPLDTGFYEVVPLAPIPEPSTWIGAALALAAIGVMGRKRFVKRFRVIG